MSSFSTEGRKCARMPPPSTTGLMVISVPPQRCGWPFAKAKRIVEAPLYKGDMPV